MKTPVIALPPKTLFVQTAKIPALIAMALHPHPEDQSVKVIGLYNNLKNRTAAEISPTHDSSISNYKWKILKEIFKDLPPLKFPLTEHQWSRYAKAFRLGGKKLRWDLIPEYASPLVSATVKRKAAEEEHLPLLQQAIASGKLKQLHPDLSKPTKYYLEDGRVLIEDLADYVAKFAVLVEAGDIKNEIPTEEDDQTSRLNTMSLMCIPRKEILAYDWPLHGKFSHKSLSRAMSDSNNAKWLKSAQTTPGVRGKASAWWNPANLAECLLAKNYATKQELFRHIRDYFPDWMDEWQAGRADDL